MTRPADAPEAGGSAYGEGPAKTGLMLALVDPVTRERIAWPAPMPLADDEIDMHGSPRDPDGRGWSVMEMEHLNTLRSTYDLPNEAAA